MVRVIPLGLALLYRYCPVTLENILSFVLLLLLFLLFLIYFSLFFSKITSCNVFYFCYLQNVFFNNCRIFFVRIKVLLTYLLTYQKHAYGLMKLYAAFPFTPNKLWVRNISCFCQKCVGTSFKSEAACSG